MSTTFRFSLLPKKTKDEIEKEDTRSSGFLYSLVLVFFTVFVWVVINLLNIFLVQDNLDKWKDIKVNNQKKIESYKIYRAENGELVIKTQILSEVVKKHLDPRVVFDLIDKRIKENTPNVQIVKYGRTSDGSFQVTGTTRDYKDINKLVMSFDEEGEIDDVRLSNVFFEENQYKFTINLLINVSATR